MFDGSIAVMFMRNTHCFESNHTFNRQIVNSTHAHFSTFLLKVKSLIFFKKNSSLIDFFKKKILFF